MLLLPWSPKYTSSTCSAHQQSTLVQRGVQVISVTEAGCVTASSCLAQAVGNQLHTNCNSGTWSKMSWAPPWKEQGKQTISYHLLILFGSPGRIMDLISSLFHQAQLHTLQIGRESPASLNFAVEAERHRQQSEVQINSFVFRQRTSQYTGQRTILQSWPASMATEFAAGSPF